MGNNEILKKKTNPGWLIMIVSILLLIPTMSFHYFIPDNACYQFDDDDIIDDDYFSDTVIVVNGISYKEYKNARFLFSINYPADFTVGKASQNGDGRRFSGKKADLVVSGHWVLEDMYENIEKYFQQKKEWKHTVTYERLTDKWFVLSGYDEDGKIFYEKTIYADYDDNDGSPIAVTATLTYDASENAYFGKIINHIFPTLK